MARKGKIEIGAQVNVTAKEDGSLSKIEKRIEDMSEVEIKVKTDQVKKAIKMIEKQQKALGSKASPILGESLAQLQAQLPALEEAKKKFKQMQTEQEKLTNNINQGTKAIKQETDAIKQLQKVKLSKDKNSGSYIDKSGRFSVAKIDNTNAYEISDNETNKRLSGLNSIESAEKAINAILEQEVTRQGQLTSATQETANAQNQIGDAVEKNTRQIFNMQSAIKRFNKLVNEVVGLDSPLEIGSAETAKWTIKDMVKYVQDYKDTYNEIGHINHDELKTSDPKTWKSHVQKLQRFINYFTPYINTETTTVGEVAGIEEVIKQQEQLTAATNETTKIRQTDAQVSTRTIKQINTELDQEKQKLQEINEEIERNDKARAQLDEKKKNYSGVVLGSDKPVYDTDKLRQASVALKEFDELLETRNKFQEKYIKLLDIISNYYVGNYAIGNGLFEDTDQFIKFNSDMKALQNLFNNGQKTTNKNTNGLFKNVIRELKSEGASVSRLINSGDVLGEQVWAKLDEEEIKLNQNNQRLLEEREESLSRINTLRQEELDLIKKTGQEDKKNNDQLKFAEPTINPEPKQTTPSVGQNPDVTENINKITDSTHEATEAMNELDAAENDVSNFNAQQIEQELSRIRNAIHSTEAGLDQVASVEGLQGALSELEKRIGDSPFKLVSAQIDSMGESVDQATLKFQSLDESMSFSQKWAMNDGELTLGRISMSQSFKDQDVFDSELYQANANAKVDKLESSLAGVADRTEKVTQGFADIRAEIANIDSQEALSKFKVSFETLSNIVQEFKNNYKSLNSISDTVRGAQTKMNNADSILSAKETNIAKYVDLDGYEKATELIREMRQELENYKNAEKNVAEGEDPTDKKIEAYQNYLKLEKQLESQTKTLQAESQFESFSKVMKNAQTEIDTAQKKLDRFGDIDGVSKAAESIQNMTTAMNEFNAAEDKQDEQGNVLESKAEQQAKAVKDYQEAKDALSKQMQYISEVQKDNTAAEKNEPISKVKEYYEQYLQIVKQLNDVNKELFAAQEKDAGTGVFGNVIEQLQSQKDTLLSQLRDVSQQVNDEILKIENPGKEYSFNFSKYFDEADTSTMAQFFNNAGVQAELSAEEIQKFIDVASQSGKIDADFGAKIAEQLQTISDIKKNVDKYNVGNKLVSTEVGSGTLNDLFKTISGAATEKLSKGTDWTGQEEASLQSLIKTYQEYANALINVAKKKEAAFKGMTEYKAGDTYENQKNKTSVAGMSEADTAKARLTAAAQEFSNGKAIIQDFITTAEGINKIKFSVFDEGTNSIRTFTMATGDASDGIYQLETTMNSTENIFKNANKQFESLGTLKQKLTDLGASPEILNKVTNLFNKLNSELSKNENADSSTLKELTQEAQTLVPELDKVIKKHQQLNETGTTIGQIQTGGSVYSQMVQSVKEYASGLSGTTVDIGKFNAQNNTLIYTLTDASGQVTTMKASLDSLNGSIVSQTTSVGQLGSFWKQFGSGLGSIGSQIARAVVGISGIYKAISMLRSGVSAVTEIDTAMTELRKVTDETDATYSKFLETAASMSGKIGTTMKEFTQATSDFARLGYSIEEATDLSKAANIYMNVGDNISNVSEATESIISTMKGFGLEADDAMSIVDKFNEVKVTCLPVQ